VAGSAAALVAGDGGAGGVWVWGGADGWSELWQAEAAKERVSAARRRGNGGTVIKG
jgi:hypothetical protein